MKTLSAIRAASAIVLAAVLSVPSGTEALEVGDKAPDFELPATTGDRSGSAISSAKDGAGRVLPHGLGPDVHGEPHGAARRLRSSRRWACIGISLDHAYSTGVVRAVPGAHVPPVERLPARQDGSSVRHRLLRGEAKRLYARHPSS